ncbi:MAG: rod shape-determining protein MreD [Capnocytophaga sp.]|nr:rod shape-determining protein MreD [Capnocytophaga sp.]
MNSIIPIRIISFIVLVLAQVLVFNHINFLGYVNPMIYLLFIIEAPFHQNKIPTLLSAFAIGLAVDLLSDTGGIHAASSVFAAYVRPLALNVAFGKNFETQTLHLSQYPIGKVFTYVAILVVLHHTLFYFLEIFNFNHFFNTFAKIGITSVFTILLCMVLIFVFSSKKK